MCKKSVKKKSVAAMQYRKPLRRLSDKQVRELRRRAADGQTVAILSILFDVHRTTVRNLIARRTRKDV